MTFWTPLWKTKWLSKQCLHIQMILWTKLREQNDFLDNTYRSKWFSEQSFGEQNYFLNNAFKLKCSLNKDWKSKWLSDETELNEPYWSNTTQLCYHCRIYKYINTFSTELYRKTFQQPNVMSSNPN